MRAPLHTVQRTIEAMITDADNHGVEYGAAIDNLLHPQGEDVIENVDTIRLCLFQHRKWRCLMRK